MALRTLHYGNFGIFLIILNPKPYTLHPKPNPSTLHPKPLTLNPKPPGASRALKSGVGFGSPVNRHHKEAGVGLL